MNTLIGANVLLGISGGVHSCYSLTVGEICPNKYKLLGIVCCVWTAVLPTGFGAYLGTARYAHHVTQSWLCESNSTYPYSKLEVSLVSLLACNSSSLTTYRIDGAIISTSFWWELQSSFRFFSTNHHHLINFTEGSVRICRRSNGLILSEYFSWLQVLRCFYLGFRGVSSNLMSPSAAGKC